MPFLAESHVRELWAVHTPAQSGQETWRSLGVGLTVIDNVVAEDLAVRAQGELEALEAQGSLDASTDSCNVGARSVWLHFETEEMRHRLPPALRELCLHLGGLPSALESIAAGCTDIAMPSLRVHPHVMAATYKDDTEYHRHKDSYDGTDNQRMVTALLYLTSGWGPGDDGELRVFDSSLAEGTFADIAPISGRLVMFASRSVWHAVRKPKRQRWALTLWIMAE